MQGIEPIIDFFIFLFWAAGALIIVWGGIRTVYYFFLPTTYPLLKSKAISPEELLRVEFGQKIVFGLEFFVAGDILTTLKGPSIDELYRLALLVAVRTVLSFFVGREVRQLDVHSHQVEREMLMTGRQKKSPKK